MYLIDNFKVKHGHYCGENGKLLEDLIYESEVIRLHLKKNTIDTIVEMGKLLEKKGYNFW